MHIIYQYLATNKVLEQNISYYMCNLKVQSGDNLISTDNDS